jgi:hypothetical protein
MARPITPAPIMMVSVSTTSTMAACDHIFGGVFIRGSVDGLCTGEFRPYATRTQRFSVFRNKKINQINWLALGSRTELCAWRLIQKFEIFQRRVFHLIRSYRYFYIEPRFSKHINRRLFAVNTSVNANYFFLCSLIISIFFHLLILWPRLRT